jgi:hypothetical protein
MPSFEVEFEVYCSCGEHLCNQSTGSSNKRGPAVTVEPCQKCLKKEYDSGYDDGYKEGQEKR